MNEEWLRSGCLMSGGDGRLWLGIGQRTWLSKPQLESKLLSFYFPDFFLHAPRPWCIYEQVHEVSIGDLIAFLTPRYVQPKQMIFWQKRDQVQFKTDFHLLQQAFAKNELHKAVPYVMETAQSAISSVQLIASLLSALDYASNNPVFLYGFWNGTEGMLGATPEMLFKVEQSDLLHTMACAGTKNVQEEEAALWQDSKELQEHDYVVQGIVGALEEFGQVKKGKLAVLKLSPLMHLVTPIAATLTKPLAFEQIVNALHPTPALGAFPREAGMRWLHSYHRKIPRRRFGAPVGYFFPHAQQAQCYVAIRNAQWNENEIAIGAGCGVVAASKYEKEWGEIDLKIRAIKQILAL